MPVLQQVTNTSWVPCDVREPAKVNAAITTVLNAQMVKFSADTGLPREAIELRSVAPFYVAETGLLYLTTVMVAELRTTR